MRPTGLLGLAGLLAAVLAAMLSCGRDDSGQDQLNPCEQVVAEMHEAIAGFCSERIYDCCFCQCWQSPSWGAYDSYIWADDCGCQCVAQSYDPLDPFDECEGEDLQSAEQCLADLPACLDPVLDIYDMFCDTSTFEDCVPGGDTDTDTDTDCDAPTGVPDWGQPCESGDDCPADTYCVSYNDPPADASEILGLCTPECCNPNTPDPDYCTDVAPGEEGCIMLGNVEQWCGIDCEENTDCPEGLACISTGVCYPPAPDTGPCDGYTGDDPCCTNDNPCDWALNDICDCDSTCAWDAVDCEW